MSDCIFCKIAEGEIPSQKVYEDEEVFAFRDLHPQAPKHVLIIPKRHIAKLADASSADRSLLGTMLLTASQIARENGMDSFRVVMNNGESAGQSVWHVHLHLLAGRSFQWPPG
jgi:histidine triad (HIT) family protein